jgi:hypothetical protein
MATAAVNAIGAYVILAFDRFGFQAFQSPRGPTRLLLIGVYGWLGLTATIWLVARRRGSIVEYGTLLQYVGYAHVPMMFVAIILQMAAVTLRWFGPGLVAGLFSLGFWFPALLVGGTRKAYDVSTSSAIGIIAAPYALWLATVAVVLFVQLAHLL